MGVPLITKNSDDVAVAIRGLLQSFSGTGPTDGIVAMVAGSVTAAAVVAGSVAPAVMVYHSITAEATNTIPCL